MTVLPYFLDNRSDEKRHAEALATILGDYDPDHPLAVATGYVNLGGLDALAALTDGRRTRLLLGAAPDPGLGAQPPAIDRFGLQLEALRTERDFSRFPPSRWARRLARVGEWLDRDDVSVRRYTQQFLHGKAYMLGSADDPRVALITSANLTAAGLHHNLELGLTSYGPPAAPEAIRWFEDLWGEAAPFDDELRELLFPDPGLVEPRDVYLRALLELHGARPEELDRAEGPSELELADFQRDGYERARAIARAHGGVVYADGVGTGKTEIGLSFIEERVKESGVYALVVTPAQLKRRWQERIHQAKLSAQVVSFQQLASDEQLNPGSPTEQRHLHSGKDYYRLVIVDEAHALRNEDTSWYRAMERLLGGSEKQVVLLTATPINNGLWDLYNVVMLFARHDRGLAQAGIDSIRELFLAAGANERDPESLDPDVLYPLADAVSVRRDRKFIASEYPEATFADGTPVRFPEPRLATERYDLDEAHPGLFERITTEIEALEMARYRPSAFLLEGEETSVEAQLGGLLKSGLLKRFESCWAACLETVERMITAHNAFLAAWEKGRVPSKEQLREAARAEEDEAGLAGWIEETLEDDAGTDARSIYRDEFAPAVAADRDRLDRIRAELSQLDPETDPKLALIERILNNSSADKVAVFATYGATVRYLDQQLPERVGGRERVVVIGGETSPDERLAALGRFAPHTVVRPDYEPDDEVDLLIATDVLSEGQNLQQAQAVVSYDMPWNPQRVVQRNGRVIRLMSEHREVYLTTILPEPGELEALLGLEATIRGKIRAASGVYGMESEVIEGIEEELRDYAERLTEGDAELLDESEEASGAFVGEELRRTLDRAFAEGEIRRIENLPWGTGACFRQTPAGRSRGAPGVFFATRTPEMPDAEHGYRYWRYVELDAPAPAGDREPIAVDLEILRRIDPQGGEPAELDDVDLEAAWQIAAASIVATHNERADLRGDQERIGPKQRWALELLRDPTVAVPTSIERAERAVEALSVERSSAVRRALGTVQDSVVSEAIGRDEAAAKIIEVAEEFGLRPVDPLPIPVEIEADDLGVVCWMVVLSAG